MYQSPRSSGTWWLLSVLSWPGTRAWNYDSPLPWEWFVRTGEGYVPNRAGEHSDQRRGTLRPGQGYTPTRAGVHSDHVRAWGVRSDQGWGRFGPGRGHSDRGGVHSDMGRVRYDQGRVRSNQERDRFQPREGIFRPVHVQHCWQRYIPTMILFRHCFQCVCEYLFVIYVAPLLGNYAIPCESEDAKDTTVCKPCPPMMWMSDNHPSDLGKKCEPWRRCSRKLGECYLYVHRLWI